MGKIVIHAGMPKAGSSSISGWLARNAADLRATAGIRLYVARAEAGVVDAVPYVSGSPNSAALLLAANDAGGDRGRVIEGFAADLGERAASERSVVISSEAFAEFFWRPEETFLTALNRLAEAHEVHVAYYVRPQDTSMVASWGQWGFRSSAPPSAYMASQEPRLHYVETYRTVARLAPNVRFVPRPFRRDMLDGDVVSDFDRHFLRGREAPTTTASPPENRGLPLDVVRGLRAAPRGLLWNSPHDNSAMRRVKRLAEGLDGRESAEASRVRRIVNRYAHKRFEPGNRELAAELGWRIDSFISAEYADEESELGRIDELLDSRASPLELGLLHHALAELVADRRPS